jgi:hypothetical protein
LNLCANPSQITTGHGPVQENLKIAIEGLLNLAELDTRDKFAVAGE